MSGSEEPFRTPNARAGDRPHGADPPGSSENLRQVNVHLLPELAHPHDLAGHSVVVVDVLRASTTLQAALTAGVARVVPCLEVPEARQLADARRSRGEPVVLGGERGGQPISGFDLGNSPAEYQPNLLEGRTLIFTTTNGTRAMMRCVGAAQVFIGSFTNLSALATRIANLSPGRVDILCAGTNGEVSWEDTLFAGALVERMKQSGFTIGQDGANIAESAWRQIGGAGLGANGLAEAFRHGQGGRNLIEIGRAQDLVWAADIDRLQVVPELDLANWEILASP